MIAAARPVPKIKAICSKGFLVAIKGERGMDLLVRLSIGTLIRQLMSRIEEVDVHDVGHVPRFRLAHLFLLIACSAVFLSVSQNSFALLNSLERGHVKAESIVGGFEALISGLAVTGLIILLLERVRGGHLTWQPGHWLLVALTPPISLSEPIQFAAIHSRDVEAANILLDVAWFVVVSLVPLILLFPLRSHLERRWKIALGTVAVSFAFNAFSELTIFMEPSKYGFGWLVSPLIDIGNLAIFVSLVTVVIVAAAELSSHQIRDWLHWIGVIVCLSPFVLMMLEAAIL